MEKFHDWEQYNLEHIPEHFRRINGLNDANIGISFTLSNVYTDIPYPLGKDNLA